MPSPFVSRTSGAAVLVALAIALPALASAAATRPASPPVVCTANVVHPISVHVTALDPIAHGQDVRFQITASSRVALENATIRVVSAGGAIPRGAQTLALGSLVPNRTSSSVITLGVPQTGNRQYVQFEVSGQGPNGPLHRGACYNLLPDGPLENGQLVITPQGTRVLQVAARRIP